MDSSYIVRRYVFCVLRMRLNVFKYLVIRECVILCLVISQQLNYPIVEQTFPLPPSTHLTSLQAKVSNPLSNLASHVISFSFMPHLFSSFISTQFSSSVVRREKSAHLIQDSEFIHHIIDGFNPLLLASQWSNTRLYGSSKHYLNCLLKYNVMKIERR